MSKELRNTLFVTMPRAFVGLEGDTVRALYQVEKED